MKKTPSNHLFTYSLQDSTAENTVVFAVEKMYPAARILHHNRVIYRVDRLGISSEIYPVAVSFTAIRRALSENIHYRPIVPLVPRLVVDDDRPLVGYYHSGNSVTDVLRLLRIPYGIVFKFHFIFPFSGKPQAGG